MPRDTYPLPLDVEAFTSDGVVEAMTTEEVGAYILLLCKAWREQPPGSIPANDGVLARWARLDADRWLACKPAVLAAFIPCADGRMVQKRAAHEYAKLRAISKRRSKAAEIAAVARWDDANRMRDASESHCGRSPPENEGVCITPTPSISSDLKDRPSMDVTDSLRSKVLEVFAHYRTYHPRAHPEPTSKGKEWKKVVAMFKEGYTVDDLKMAIDGCHRSPFHCGENDRGKTYQSLDLIVRDSSHVNQFMEIPVNAAVLSEKTIKTLRAGDSFLKKRMGGSGAKD